MDIVNKIYSSIMCGRLFKIISKHGVKCRFGSTPGVGCQYGTFTINTLIHLRHNHNLPTWVSFADLAKASDTSNHALIIVIIGKIWRTPKTMIRNKTHVQQKHSQAHHWQGRDIHQLQSGCQTRIQHGPCTVYVLNDSFLRNPRR